MKFGVLQLCYLLEFQGYEYSIGKVYKMQIPECEKWFMVLNKLTQIREALLEINEVNIRNIQTCKNLYELICTKLTIVGKQNLSGLGNSSENCNSVSCFINYNHKRGRRWVS